MLLIISCLHTVHIAVHTVHIAVHTTVHIAVHTTVHLYFTGLPPHTQKKNKDQKYIRIWWK